MTRVLSIFIVAVAVCTCSARTSDLEHFLISGFNKENPEETQETDRATKTTTNELVNFMKRAGLFGSGSEAKDQQRALLQSVNPQAAVYYVPQESQSLTNYVAPKRQPEPEKHEKMQYIQKEQQRTAQLLQQLRQLQQQQQRLQQQKQSPQSSKPVNTAYTPKTHSSTDLQDDTSSKTLSKADRQGLYSQDGLYDGGYSGNHDGGYTGTGDSYSDNGYGVHSYAPEPAYHKPYSPPSVAIKIDPIGILRLLLAGIPKPLLNLNGKVFFGVELGKHAGIGIGKGVGGYAQPHQGYQGGGKVITIG